MQRLGLCNASPLRVIGLLLIGMLSGCASAAESARVQPAPVLLQWPDPAFLPERQCRGEYALEDLQRYLPRARRALWLPGTRAVTVDPARRCITLLVEGVGTGRLAELVMRGVTVPRRAVLLTLTSR
jgi:hypothetical protein